MERVGNRGFGEMEMEMERLRELLLLLVSSFVLLPSCFFFSASYGFSVFSSQSIFPSSIFLSIFLPFSNLSFNLSFLPYFAFLSVPLRWVRPRNPPLPLLSFLAGAVPLLEESIHKAAMEEMGDGDGDGGSKQNSRSRRRSRRRKEGGGRRKRKKQRYKYTRL
jgi:hypothetical protein